MLQCQIVAHLFVLLGMLLIQHMALEVDPKCPMSSTMNMSQSFHYPVDIYGSRNDLVRVLLQNKTVPCYSLSMKNNMNQHYCSLNEKLCPLQRQNVVDAVQRSIGAPSMCHLKKRLNDSTQKIRIVVFGGSVTVGCRAQWCNPSDGPDIAFSNPRCSWFYHFSEWLKSVSVAKVEYYNLAGNSQNSYASANIMAHQMKKLHSLDVFTANDLIFLDHSCNDVDKRAIIVERQVETLIRRVYSLSVNNSWPSVVLLDANPLKRNKIYPEVYGNMSQYYNIPMWSYREAVQSDYVKLHQSHFAAVVNFSQNDWSQGDNSPDIHPPWHVHLFMADLYSAIFKQTLENCSDSQVLAAEKHHTQSLFLPSAVAVHQSSLQCQGNVPEYLNISLDDVQRGVSVGSFFIHNSASRGSWSLREDGKRRGRGGFIVERPQKRASFSGGGAGAATAAGGGAAADGSSPSATKTAKAQSVVSYSAKTIDPLSRRKRPPVRKRAAPGSIASPAVATTIATAATASTVDADTAGSETKDPPAGVLSFTFANSTSELKKKFGSVFAQIAYLRTYYNAGAVNVLFCGVRVAFLNALWEDHETNRVSTPEWVQLKLVLSECDKNNYTYPVIDFYHLYGEVNHEKNPVQGNYKFKLLNIKVCAENTFSIMF